MAGSRIQRVVRPVLCRRTKPKAEQIVDIYAIITAMRGITGAYT